VKQGSRKEAQEAQKKRERENVMKPWTTVFELCDIVRETETRN
jgi:hypothetical protein